MTVDPDFRRPHLLRLPPPEFSDLRPRTDRPVYTARIQVSNLRHVLSALYDQLAVHRKAFLIAVLVCLVALVVAYPAIESVDHWDAPGPTSDSELQYIGILTVVGAIALFTQVLALLALLLFTFVCPNVNLHLSEEKRAFAFFPLLTASPPLALRI